MRVGPPVRFTRRPDGRHLAYQVVGEGDLDLVYLSGWSSHLGLAWTHPSVADYFGKLSSFSRLILFDRLGNGLSDRGPTGHAFEDWMDDVRCVMAAAGSQQAAFFGHDIGGRLALLLAATYPDQAAAVVTFGSHPATLRDQDYPWGSTPEELEGMLAAVQAGTFDLAKLWATIAPQEAAWGRPLPGGQWSPTAWLDRRFRPGPRPASPRALRGSSPRDSPGRAGWPGATRRSLPLPPGPGRSPPTAAPAGRRCRGRRRRPAGSQRPP